MYIDRLTPIIYILFIIWLRTVPHVVACLGRDEQLVAIGTEVFVHHAPQRLLGRTIGRSVVVSQVEVGDTVVEGVTQNLFRALVVVDTTEVMPQAKTDLEIAKIR